MIECPHVNQIRNVKPRTPQGREECLRLGDPWVHLRLCLTCGHVGCCDSSPNKHATPLSTFTQPGIPLSSHLNREKIGAGATSIN